MGTQGDSARSGNELLLSTPTALTPWGDMQGGYEEWSSLRDCTYAPTAVAVEQHEQRIQAETSVHDPPMRDAFGQTRNYDQSKSYQALGNSTGIKAEEQLQRNPSEHEELSVISQNDNGSRDFIASQPQAQHYNSKTGNNESYVYNRNDPRQIDPSPRGYHAVANVVAQKLWVPHINPQDRTNIHKTGLDGFIAVPGQPGNNQGIRVRFYNEGAVSPTGN